MGADTFYHVATGKSASDAFQKAVDEAQWESGHGGYTGTIAEKGSFVMIECPDDMKPDDYADDLIEKGDHRIDDKWGDAGCIDMGLAKDGKNHKYLFFGWASS